MKIKSLLVTLGVLAIFGQSLAQPSRGTVAIYPVLFDSSGTPTSRQKTEDALYEVFKKGGFKVVSENTSAAAWKKQGLKTPTYTRPPSVPQLAKFGESAGARYVVMAQINYRTRSIWVNLGPKTISSCDVSITIIDTEKKAIAYEADASARSDEKSDPLKVAGTLLISPLVTAVSGGPKTPQESRAGQIAVAKALEKFIVVD